MKQLLLTMLLLVVLYSSNAQIDPILLRREIKDSIALPLNMDAVYNRPFIQNEKLPVSLGGYMEVNYARLQKDGFSDGHQFEMRRFTLFVASTVSKRIKSLSELEFEDGTKEINIEFAAADFSFSPLLNIRGGIIMNPIGAFNQNHDGPKWEFTDRPVAATQMLPATWSNTGIGVYGKKHYKGWSFGYELYATNGFDEQIVNNEEGKTSLPASKENKERFSRSINGEPLITAKVAMGHRKTGELGLSYMSGIYNRYAVDGLVLDKKRAVRVVALDYNITVPGMGLDVRTEWAWIAVDIPDTYGEQYGKRQQGGFIDFVQPVLRASIAGYKKSVINAALRMEYVDWNKGKFASTGSNIADDFFSIQPAISWRPSPATVLRFNYRYNWQRDIQGNPPSRTAGFLVGLSTYF